MRARDLALRRAERRVLSADVYEVLRELLLDQRLAPGERVGIDALARETGVSPTPVREALVRLEAEGLVRKEDLRGYFVAPPLDAEALDELYDLRLLLEPPTAARAAQRLQAADLAELRRCTAAMRKAPTGGRFKQFRQFADADAAFHETLARVAGNRHVYDALTHARVHSHLSRLYFERGVVDASDSVPEHEAILAALAAHDAKGARTAMRDHVERSRKRVLALVADAADV